MMFRMITLWMICGATLAAGCTPYRAFTRGKYQDPNEIQMLGDRFSESDLQILSRHMARSLTEAKVFRAQGSTVLIFGAVENRTQEHVDLEALSDMVRQGVSERAEVVFVEDRARFALANEYDYQANYVANPKKKGEQLSPDYLLTGRLSSIVSEVGHDKVVYYKLTMEMTDIRTGAVRWSDEKQLRKKMKARPVIY